MGKLDTQALRELVRVPYLQQQSPHFRAIVHTATFTTCVIALSSGGTVKNNTALLSIIAIVVLLAFAHSTRYEVVGHKAEGSRSSAGMVVFVWDRWLHRTCMHGMWSDDDLRTENFVCWRKHYRESKD